MAQNTDKGTSLPMKIVIITFAVILVLSLCLPFFSSCSNSSSTSSTSEDETTTTTSETVSEIDADYQVRVDALIAKQSADGGASSLAVLANLGNAYMDWGGDLQSATDADDNEDHVQEVFSTAVNYYDQYLDQKSDSNTVRMNRAVCLYYSGAEDDGIAALEELVEDNHDFSPAWYYLGILYELDDRSSAARDAYTRAVSADAVESYNVSTYAQYRMLIMDALEQAAASASSTADAAQSSDLSAGADSTDGEVSLPRADVSLDAPDASAEAE